MNKLIFYILLLSGIFAVRPPDTHSPKPNPSDTSLPLPLTLPSSLHPTSSTSTSTSTSSSTLTNITIITYNLNETPTKAATFKFLESLSYTSQLVVVTTQETEPLKPRRNEGSRSVALRTNVISSLSGGNFVPLAIHSMGGLQIMVFIRANQLKNVTFVHVSDVATGVGNVLGNKGGIGVFVGIGKETYAFVNSHLAAHEGGVEARNADFWRIQEELHGDFLQGVPKGLRVVQPLQPNTRKRRRKRILKSTLSSNSTSRSTSKSTSKSTSRSKSTLKLTRPSTSVPLFDSVDHVFWSGDLNYRIPLPRTIVTNLLKKRQFEKLLKHDQLNIVRANSEAFNGLGEAKITFPPTYKFDKGTMNYDTSQKQRVPSWTDRILFKLGVGVECLEYSCVRGDEGREGDKEWDDENDGCSDHKCVFGRYRVIRG